MMKYMYSIAICASLMSLNVFCMEQKSSDADNNDKALIWKQISDCNDVKEFAGEFVVYAAASEEKLDELTFVKPKIYKDGNGYAFIRAYGRPLVPNSSAPFPLRIGYEIARCIHSGTGNNPSERDLETNHLKSNPMAMRLASSEEKQKLLKLVSMEKISFEGGLKDDLIKALQKNN